MDDRLTEKQYISLKAYSNNTVLRPHEVSFLDFKPHEFLLQLCSFIFEKQDACIFSARKSACLPHL